MTPVLYIALQVLFCFSLIAFLIGAVSMAAWHVVYYACRCRRNPIGKTALLAAAGLWLVSAALVAVV